jgi:cold-inducible RNA-binding protein
MKNVFVGNLDVTTTEEQLRDLFQSHGTVATVTLVKDRDTGVPRGFAFVEMPNDAEADIAIQALNGTLLDQHPLRVNEARPKEEGERGNPVERQRKSREPLAKRKHREHRY